MRSFWHEIWLISSQSVYGVDFSRVHPWIILHRVFPLRASVREGEVRIIPIFNTLDEEYVDPNLDHWLTLGEPL